MGATLAAAGLRRRTPLATAALVLGANAPDIDFVSYFGGPYQSLAFRRGATHGLLALAILPFLVAGLVLLWDRGVRRRRRPAAEPARAGALLGLAALAVLTHPALDWLNNYGMRWLMPFDGTWFYGDAVFIIDPWIWLGFGGVLFVLHSRGAAALSAWSVFWLLASLLVLTTAAVPFAARVLWLAGLAAALTLRRLTLRSSSRDAALERAARVLLCAGLVYVGLMIGADFAERSRASAELAARGIAPVVRVMVAPVAANPFRGEVVAETDAGYYVGAWSWLAAEPLELAPELIAKRNADPRYAAAAATLEARRFLTWARFPYALIENDANAHVVTFLDARYHATGRLFGPTVRLDSNLRPIAVE